MEEEDRNLNDSLQTLHFDKLRSLKPETEIFSFGCEDCNSENISLIPIGVAIRPEGIDNGDLEKIDRDLMLRLNNLPSLQTALKESRKEDLICSCKDCNISFSIKETIVELDMRKWIKKYLGNANLFLGSRI